MIPIPEDFSFGGNQSISPSIGVRDDGTRMYEAIPECSQERIAGIDPATGQPDERFDGTITTSVPIQMRGRINLTPDPSEPKLVQVVHHGTGRLVVAPTLDAGFASIEAEQRSAAIRQRFIPGGRP